LDGKKNPETLSTGQTKSNPHDQEGPDKSVPVSEFVLFSANWAAGG
jgi:hypothetical protein